MRQLRISFLLTLVAVVPAVSQYVTGPGEVAVPARRYDSWVYGGGDREVMELTVSRITTLDGDGPGNWTYEWRKVAAFYEERAAKAESKIDKTPAYARHDLVQSAQDNYLKAQLYYAIGYFPDNRTPAQRASYQKHVETYLKAARYFAPPVELVKVPYKGSFIPVHLHRPEGVQSPPLVLWTGGVDWWKGSIYHELRDAVSRGLAVAAFDLAGTGEMDQFPATPESYDVHLAVMNYFAEHGFERNRMAYVGESFGGYYAVQLAASDAGFKAVVNLCGGTASDSVSTEAAMEAMKARLASTEGGSVRASAHAVGVPPPYDFRTMVEKMAGFNLKAKGTVGQGQTIKTPLLNIDGAADPSFPWRGFLTILDSSQQGELWLLGSSGHCARDYFTLTGPQLADWLAEKLK
jgi:esterase FrsA